MVESYREKSPIDNLDHILDVNVTGDKEKMSCKLVRLIKYKGKYVQFRQDGAHI